MSLRSKLFTKFNPSDLFEEWYEETRGEDNFEENMGFYDHVREEFKEEVIRDYLFDNNIDREDFSEEDKDFKLFYEKQEEERIKGYADDWFYDRLAGFTSDLEKKTEFNDQGIICRRALKVDDEGEFIFHLLYGLPIGDFTGLGVCWSWDKSKAEAHWGKGSILMEVDAIIPWSAIDQRLTFSLNMNPSLGEDEAEIRVHESVELLVLGVNEEEFPEPVTVLS